MKNKSMNFVQINRLVGGAVVALAVIIAAILALDNFTSVFGKKIYKVQASFNHVGNLTVNSPVQLGGVIVGRVVRIGFNPDGRINLVAQLELENPLPVDSILGVTSTLVSGDMFVNVYRGRATQMIAAKTRNRDAVELRGADFFSINNLGTLFAHFGKLFANVVQGFEELCGADAPTLQYLANIKENSHAIQAQLDDLSDFFHARSDKYAAVRDKITKIFAEGKDAAEKFEFFFSPQYRQVLAKLLADNANSVLDLQKTLTSQEATITQAITDFSAIQTWADGLKFSEHSVVGVLLKHPQYNATATVDEIKAAYHEIMDRSFVGKVALLLKNYLRAKSLTGDFAKNLRPKNAPLEIFYRQWLIHAARQKAIYGYIKAGKNE